jgi:hypothetical protein
MSDPRPPMKPASVFDSLISIFPTVSEYLDFEQCLKYIDLIQLLMPTLSLSLLPEETGPLPLTRLPLNVHIFLCKCLDLEHEDAKIIWQALSPVAWKLVICRGFQTRAGLGQGFGGYGLGSGFPDPALPLTRTHGFGGCAAAQCRSIQAPLEIEINELFR